MIRSQQAQLQQLQQQQQQNSTGTAVVDETSTTPQSDHSTSFPPLPPLPPAGNRTSTQLSSSLSRSSSQAASPNLRPQSSFRHLRGGPEESVAATSDSAGLRRSSRDETAFYQAEAAMLNRENQMLRQRVRDLGMSFFFFSTAISAAFISIIFPLRHPSPSVLCELRLC